MSSVIAASAATIAQRGDGDDLLQPTTTVLALLVAVRECETIDGGDDLHDQPKMQATTKSARALSMMSAMNVTRTSPRNFRHYLIVRRNHALCFPQTTAPCHRGETQSFPSLVGNGTAVHTDYVYNAALDDGSRHDVRTCRRHLAERYLPNGRIHVLYRMTPSLVDVVCNVNVSVGGARNG